MDSSPFVRAVARHWWIFLLRGILAVLFGILAFAWPTLTLLTLMLLFGAYAFIDGLTALWVGASARQWSFIFVGILGIIAGILMFFYPGITAIVLLYLIASWAIVRGVFEISAAIRLRKKISNEWLLILGGIISILFGVVLVFNPAAGALAMVWLIGIYALVFGMMMIVLAFRLRGLRGRAEARAGRSEAHGAHPS